MRCLCVGVLRARISTLLSAVSHVAFVAFESPEGTHRRARRGGVGAFGAFSYRGFSTNDTWEAHDQYDDLANAFLSGSVVIDKEVPEAIRELDNPYDPGARAVALQEAGQSELSGRITDFAYYNGQFYSYFGPVPALMLFVPFKLITGHDMPTWLAVFFYGALFIVAIKVLLVLLCDRLLKLRPSLGLFLLADFLLCGTTGLIYLAICVVYSVPITLVAGVWPSWGLVWLAGGQARCGRGLCAASGGRCRVHCANAGLPPVVRALRATGVPALLGRDYALSCVLLATRHR